MKKPTLTLTEDQVRFFNEQGYLSLERISRPEEVEFLKSVFDRLFSEKAGRQQGYHYDLVGADQDDEVQTSPQIIYPVFFAPELKKTSFRANALAIAKQLLGPKASVVFEHAILKPAAIGAPTPWHQDEAFKCDYGPGYNEISIWMPLQAVDVSNGCLQFLPGSHRKPVLRHASPGNDPRVHGLVCVDGFDETQAVACPLPAGGCTVHHIRTLHRAGPNTSPNPRRAYILVFAAPLKIKPEHSPPFSWNLEKQTAREQRHVAWRKHGGALVEFRRSVQRKLGRLINRNWPA